MFWVDRWVNLVLMSLIVLLILWWVLLCCSGRCIIVVISGVFFCLGFGGVLLEVCFWVMVSFFM